MGGLRGVKAREKPKEAWDSACAAVGKGCGVVRVGRSGRSLREGNREGGALGETPFTPSRMGGLRGVKEREKPKKAWDSAWAAAGKRVGWGVDMRWAWWGGQAGALVKLRG
jgi:hypothetical protein